MEFTTRGTPHVLEGYSDSNWILDADEIIATSGFVFTLAGAAVAWRSYKQTVSTKSTADAELVALETATNEVEWLREQLMDLPLLEKPVPPIVMYCDNQSMLAQVMIQRIIPSPTSTLSGGLKLLEK